MGINIKNPTYYSFSYDVDNDVTEERLKQLNSLGCESVGFGQFGIPNVFSGLYVEKVWSYTDEQWDDYIEWFTNLSNYITWSRNKNIKELIK